jgi:hypothetical protein
MGHGCLTIDRITVFAGLDAEIVQVDVVDDVVLELNNRNSTRRYNDRIAIDKVESKRAAEKADYWVRKGRHEAEEQIKKDALDAISHEEVWKMHEQERAEKEAGRRFDNPPTEMV